LDLLRNYEGLIFDRRHKAPDALSRVVGVGHPAIDQPLRQASAWSKSTAILASDDLPQPIPVFRIPDRTTGTGNQVRSIIAGVEMSADSEDPSILPDWRLLERLNTVTTVKKSRGPHPCLDAPPTESVRNMVHRAEAALLREIPSMDLPFRFPTLDLLGLFWTGRFGDGSSHDPSAV